VLDRESTFADPTIVKLLQTRFIPVAIDQAYQRRQKDNEGRFYQKIANQGPRKIGRGTTQGLYTADAAGTLLAFTNNRGAQRVQRMLQTALQKHQPVKVAAITKGLPDARYNPQPPEGGLVVRVTSKILSGYEEPENEFRRIFQTSLGRDNLWIRADEHTTLAKGQLPKSLLKRLARYHLVDNTRGEPTMWRENEIEKLEGAEINEAKIKLANEATRMCHGDDAAQAAEETARRTFVEGGSGEDLPRVEIGKDRLSSGVPIYELMREAGLAKSNGEARRLIKGGGGRLNDTVISEETASATLDDLNAEGVLKLSAGRKRHALVVPS